LDVKEVTVFAVSTQNLNRSKDERENLFNLIKQQFSAVLEER